VTACQDTYRGRVCECPVVNGVRYEGDGYTDCKGKVVAPSSSLLNDKLFFPHAAAAYVFYLHLAALLCLCILQLLGRAGALSTTAGAGRRREGTRPSPPARYVTQTRPTTSDSDPIHLLHFLG
jgi:hypothetical protein